MNGLILASIVCVASGSFISNRGGPSSEDDTGRGHGPNNHIPPGHDVYPDGFWFGTQNLLCVLGVQAFEAASQLLGNIRDKRSPERGTRDTVHRIIYYRGEIFEWGIGIDYSYNHGTRPAASDCRITWERAPAGVGNCDLDTAKMFTVNYSTNYGLYNLLTNNCHHFANRVASMLSSETCTAEPPENRSRATRVLWKVLKHLRTGQRPSWLDQILPGSTNTQQEEQNADTPTID